MRQPHDDGVSREARADLPYPPAYRDSDFEVPAYRERESPSPGRAEPPSQRRVDPPTAPPPVQHRPQDSPPTPPAPQRQWAGGPPSGSADPRRQRPDGPPRGPSDPQRRLREGPPPGGKVPWKVLAGVGAAILVVIIGIAVAFPNQFKHQLAISVARQATPYTQLYFSTPGTLPITVKPGKTNSFKFAIQNSESRTYKYTYVVTLADSHSHLVVSTESVTIANGDSVTRTVTVTPKDHKSKYLVTISLEGINQSIHMYEETS